MINNLALNEFNNYSAQGTTRSQRAKAASSFASLLSGSLESSKSIGDVNAGLLGSDDGEDLLSGLGMSSDLFMNMLSGNTGSSGIADLFGSVFGMDSSFGLGGTSGSSYGLGSTSSSGYSSYSNLFSQVKKGGTGGSYLNASYAEAIPTAASKATNPYVRNDSSNRKASIYRQVINQFNVETNPRYEVNKKGRGDTYCNIFVWDVTSAMGAEIPHYINPTTRNPVQYPNTKGAKELNANATYDWLNQKGTQYGWHEVTAEQAQHLANQGKPVVTAKKNNSGHGHVQVVCPSSDGRYDPSRGVTIAQAGGTLTNYSTMASLYGSNFSQFRYYAHT